MWLDQSQKAGKANMKRKTFLTLVSAIAMFVGVISIFAPAVLLESKGVLTNPAANVWARELGISLVSIAFIAFAIRDQPDSPTMKAFLLGNAILQIGLLPIEIIAFANGTLTKLSGIVPNSLLHIGLGAAFCFYASNVRVADVGERER